MQDVFAVFSTAGGWVVSIILGVIALVGVLWPRRGSLENTRIDQLQEDRDADRLEMKAMRDRLDKLDQENGDYRKKVQRLLERDLKWKQYHHRILLGVADGSIPPLPELPADLMEEP